MITFEEAIKIVSSIPFTISTESIELSSSVGRILAEDVFSDMDMPPFDKSAMDGYACLQSDLPGPLKVLEIIPAGVQPSETITSGYCSKIMTGGIVPAGADCILKVEETESSGEGYIRFTSKYTFHNICFKGEDIKTGDRVLTKGTEIQPQHIAVMAAVGYCNPLVNKKLRAGILVTGDELVEPHKKPSDTKIRNSNGWQIIAQCLRAGLEPNYYGIIPDEQDNLFLFIQKSLNENNILLLTGGVSMGDFDYVPAMLRKAGVEIIFEKVAVQPGSPTLFGKTENCFVFGLPGNPVSTFVQFELMVRALANKLNGLDYQPRMLPLQLATTYSRKKAFRKSFFPVKVDESGKVKALEYHGSAHIFSFSEANAIASIEAGCFEIPEGDYINVRFI